MGADAGIDAGPDAGVDAGPGQVLPPLALDAGCNPLFAGADCFLPYPTDFFRVADPTSPTGYWIKTTGAAKLVTASGIDADMTDFRPLDGYSHLPVVVGWLPQAISDAGFVGLLDDAAESTQPQSAILLIDTSTGAAVPHWVDLDPRASRPDRQAILLHPLSALKYATRYVVVLHGVLTATGDVATPPEGFRRLRDQQTTGDPVLAPLQSHYDQAIFSVIADAGVPRAQTQLAWDFTTGDEGQADGDMLRVRELTLAWLSQNTPVAVLTADNEDGGALSWRQVQGVVTGPSFLTGDLPGAQLFRNDAGEVVQNGLKTFTFTANVPVTVQDQFGPGRTVSYGHGFFGSQAEVTEPDTMQIAYALRSVFICIDWLGMSTPDAALIGTNMVHAPSQALSALERVPQAMANWIVLEAALRGPLHSPGLFGPTAFQRPSSGPGTSIGPDGGSNAGQLVYDGATTNFLGISQGAILGATLASLSPDFSQIGLNVGGAGFTQLMTRSHDFEYFLLLLAGPFPDGLDQQKFVSTMQPMFDRVDPATYAPYVLQAPLPGSPPRQVLQQNGLGDPEVPNLGTFLASRMLGVVEMSPNDFPVFGLDQRPPPVGGAALTLWDYGLDLEAVYGLAIPASLTGDPIHTDLRMQPAVLAQLDAFFEVNAGIIDPCGGMPCRSVDGGEGLLPDGG
jgi:hypothetical protein